jgi:hypothetical protein
MMVRKYNGYELGIWFFNDKVTGQVGLDSLWLADHLSYHEQRQHDESTLRCARIA